MRQAAPGLWQAMLHGKEQPWHIAVCKAWAATPAEDQVSISGLGSGERRLEVAGAMTMHNVLSQAFVQWAVLRHESPGPAFWQQHVNKNVQFHHGLLPWGQTAVKMIKKQTKQAGSITEAYSMPKKRKTTTKKRSSADDAAQKARTKKAKTTMKKRSSAAVYTAADAGAKQARTKKTTTMKQSSSAAVYAAAGTGAQKARAKKVKKTKKKKTCLWYAIRPFSKEVHTEPLVRLHKQGLLFNALTVPRTTSQWCRAQREATAAALPMGLAGSAYHWPWIVRTNLLTEARYHGISQLRVDEDWNTEQAVHLVCAQ